MTDSMRDRIDRAIYDAWNLERGDEIPYLSPEAREAVIDALLAEFPWLSDEPTARADAWAEGYRAGWHDRDDDAKAGWGSSRYEQGTPNPYRKADR